MTSVYCVKCKAKKEVDNMVEVTVQKTGRPALTGTCPDCGTKVFKFVSTKK